MNIENNVYYVYLHRRGDNNEVFYVGKGKNGRYKSKAGRNNWWTNVVDKCGFSAEIVECGLSEQAAFDLEVELILFYRERTIILCATFVMVVKAHLAQ